MGTVKEAQKNIVEVSDGGGGVKRGFHNGEQKLFPFIVPFLMNFYQQVITSICSHFCFPETIKTITLGQSQHSFSF